MSIKKQLHRVLRVIREIVLPTIKYVPWFYIFRIVPLKRKVVGSCFSGNKYGENPKFILEKIHEIDPTIDLVWLKSDSFEYEVPDYIRQVKYNSVRMVYELATAKVWVDSHRIRRYYRKRKGQKFLLAYHGGLGLKKIGIMASPGVKVSMGTVENEYTSKLIDLLISNCEFATENKYRKALEYKGEVWLSGYPKNDILFADNTKVSEKIKNIYKIDPNTKIALYAPTFRGNGQFEAYDLDGNRLAKNLNKRFGGNWVVFVRFHPGVRKLVDGINNYAWSSNVINVTDYPETAELLLACDILISDYSSTIFDGALRRIPCFLYASDYEDYTKKRNLWFKLNELPFPFAENNDELEEKVVNYNQEKHLALYEEFYKKVGFYETGHASYDVAKKMIEFVDEIKKV